MTLYDPQTRWDLVFQLSALATASLFAYGNGTEALPLILYSFGNLSIVAPLANVVLLPIVPSAMLFGALALVGGMIWLPLGQWLADVNYCG
jgi:competence protein ComEC